MKIFRLLEDQKKKKLVACYFLVKKELVTVTTKGYTV